MMIIRSIIFLLVFRAHSILCDHHNITSSSSSRVFNCKTNVTNTKNDFFCSSSASSCSETCESKIFCCSPGLCCEKIESNDAKTETHSEDRTNISDLTYGIVGTVVGVSFFIWCIIFEKLKKQNQSQVLAYQNSPLFNLNYENNQDTSIPTVPPPQYNETPGMYTRQNVNQNSPRYPKVYRVYSI